MGDTHARNTGPILAAARCGAKTRRRTQAPAVQGKKRCRTLGGTKGSGAPPGNTNALKSGLHTAEALALRRHVNQLVRNSRALFEKF